MKKLLSIILALMISFSLAACSKKDTEETVKPADKEVVEKDNTSDKKNPVEDPEKDKEEDKDEDKEEDKNKEDKEDIEDIEEDKENKEEDKKKEDKEDAKDPEKETPKEPEKKPEVKPETKPEEDEKPEVKPEEKPQTSKTVGQTLLSAFQSSASNSASALSIAETLVTNDVIAFGGGAMPVEEGLLTGFDNTEIKGFSEGAMFAPMIGTIPFVGYVFTLAEGTNSSEFISTLRSAANLRWNICTTADEMLTGNVGNKVFFVMCPASFEDAE